ncbi:hypothetical protein H2203_003719 [Taxawa tesnikishii (nom. ined.)]|nr:hypothetical protein H2203_003719 [Dothideales sp. JES 119]
MSNISAESVYYENFRRVMVVNDSLEKVLVAAAPLRHFLLRMNRKDMVSSVEDQIVQLYAKRYIEDVQLMSKDSPRTFIVGILDYLANHKTADFVRAVILASNKTVAGLVKNKRFKEAYDVAEMAFRFAQQHKGYHGPRAISRGFELASYLDGRGENRCTDEGLRKQLLQLSSSIIKEILQVCRDQKINFAQVQLPELNQVIALLGEQQDYKTLEWLLNTLWNNREAQRAWPPQVLLNLGRRLVCARYLAKHSTESIRLCEDIVYNMRRVYGARHPVTLETCDLLAQLYTSTGQQCQSQAAHDKSAALLAGEYFKRPSSADADDEDEDTAAAILMEHGVTIDEDGDGVQDEDQVDRAALAKQHLRLLKFAFQRLGAWPKQYNAYEKLNADVFATFGAQLQGVEGVEKWSPNGFGKGKAESTEGAFGGVKDWQIASVPFGVSSAA